MNRHASRYSALLCLGILTSCSAPPEGSADTAAVTRNHLPQIIEVTVEPSAPRPTEPLVATARARDIDGDAAAIDFTWSVDGEVVDVTGPVLRGVPLARGQEVVVTAVASDGYGVGPPTRSAPVVVANTPPRISGLSVQPERARAGDPLTCVVAEAFDADGDPITLAIRWTATGEPLEQEGPVITGPVRDDEVRCHATPSDGLDEGDEVSSAASVIANTPPSLERARITPSDPVEGDVLTIRTSGYTDPDDDPEGYRYEWYVNDVLRATSRLISGDSVNTGQTIYAIVTPTDGLSTGDPVTTPPVVVGGGRPGAPTVSVTPLSGVVAGKVELVCSVVVDSLDPSGDPVTYAFEWLRDGVFYSLEEGVADSRVPVEAQSPGETWTCRVTPRDATGDGAPTEREVVLSPLADLWGVQDTLRVSRTPTELPLSDTNAVWDGSSLTILAARGEVVAVQLIAETAGAVTLDAEVSTLRHEDGVATLQYEEPVGDPSLTAGRPVALYVQHYLEVTHPTDAPDWVSAATPSQPLAGSWPGPLVPENATLGGLPIDIPAGVNQGLWLEIWVGPERLPGIYTGNVELDVDGVGMRIPLTLSVSPYVLPVDDRLEVVLPLDTEAILARHGEDVSEAYHRLAHRHRVELATPGDATVAEAQAARASGELYRAEFGYGGPGATGGDRVFARSWLEAPPGWYDPAIAAEEVTPWMEAVTALRPDALALVWTHPSPSPSDLPEFLTLGEAVDTSDAPGPDAMVLGLLPPQPDLGDAMDGWVVAPSDWSDAQADAERDAGRAYWWLEGQRPWSGAMVLDTPALDTRMHGVLAYAAGVDVLPIGHANRWSSLEELPLDVWTDPVTWDDGVSLANGAGTFIWPGEDLLFPEADRGLPGPVASIRLAMLRRAVQDHRILVAAEEAGLTELIDETLAELVPAVLDGVAPADPIGFDEDPEVWEHRRRMIIESLSMLEED